MKTGKVRKALLWTGLSALLLFAIAALLWLRVFHHYPPAELMKDVRAGIAVGHIEDPAERFQKYVENRYGPMSDPANQRKAFLDFFSTEWNFWLNGAPYYEPDEAAIHTNEAPVIVNQLFGTPANTPLIGDAAPFHGAEGILTGENALYFDGSVKQATIPNVSD